MAHTHARHATRLSTGNCMNLPCALPVYPPCRSVCEAVVLGCTAFFESQGTLVRKSQSPSWPPRESHRTHSPDRAHAAHARKQDQLPDCDQIDNSTGTPLPAFPPDGTQCLSVPPDLCTLLPQPPRSHSFTPTIACRVCRVCRVRRVRRVPCVVCRDSCAVHAGGLPVSAQVQLRRPRLVYRIELRPDTDVSDALSQPYVVRRRMDRRSHPHAGRQRHLRHPLSIHRTHSPPSTLPPFIAHLEL